MSLFALAPEFMSMLVELYILAEKPESGLGLLEELFKIAESTNQHYYDAELFRLKGEALLQHSCLKDNFIALPEPVTMEIESCLHSALKVAREQDESVE